MNPQTPIARAQAHIESRRFDEARATLLRAVTNAPNDPNLAAMLCYVLAQTGEYERSAYYGERAVAARPDAPDLRMNLAASYMDLARPEDAAAQFEAVGALRPDEEQPLEHLVAALNQAGRFIDAERTLADALSRFPESSKLASRRADTLTATGRPTEAVEALRGAIANHPEELAPLTDLCSTLPFDPEAAPHAALLGFRAFGAVLQQRTPRRAPLPPRNLDPHRPLRIGFLSPDLRAHAVATFLEPLLEHLDAAKVQTLAFSTAPREDGVSARLRSLVGRWRSGAVQSMAGAIVQEAPDVLFDLSGHSAGHALPLFQLRLAPIQITYLGWPATTGVPEMDYRLTDSNADPDGNEAFHTERLLRLDPCALCYKPHPDAPPATINTHADHPPTLGSFNSIAKLNARVVDLWARILHEAGDARLILKHTALAHEQGRAIVRQRFADAGVAPARLLLLPPTSHATHLEAYHQIDLALDPFPFNGATTTCDALHMGVPVVTMPGESSCSRVGASILRAAGRDDGVAQDERQYVARATALLSDVGRLRSDRSALRRQFLDAPICDGAAFARRFEQVVRQAWTEHCNSA